VGGANNKLGEPRCYTSWRQCHYRNVENSQ